MIGGMRVPVIYFRIQVKQQSRKSNALRRWRFMFFAEGENDWWNKGACDRIFVFKSNSSCVFQCTSEMALRAFR